MTKRTASRLDWADRVARWRARAPKQRAAITDGDTRYYFAGQRFVHCIRVRELSRMDTTPPGPLTARWLRQLVSGEHSAT